MFRTLSAILTLLMAAHAQAGEHPQAAAHVELKAWRLPEISYPADNPDKKITAELGEQLFFDPRLSGERTLACASCHFPGLGWTDPLPNSLRQARALERRTLSLVNVGYMQRFFWDGRSDSLEAAIELHLKEQSQAATGIPALPASYRKRFQQAFGSPAITSKSIAKALANFLRSITVRDSSFDRWIAGNRSALSPSAQRGFRLFTGKARCSTCHTPPLFSDSDFHNTGLNTLDPGHFDISGDPADRNRFRTPALRQVSRAAPYMHNSSKESLREVIEYYNRGGDRQDDSNELEALDLSEEEKQELLDFLTSLTGSNPPATIPQLPTGENP